MNITIYTIIFLTILSIWEAVWKGFALWKSAQKRQNSWFICILIFNTIGILPIVYLLIENSKQNSSRTLLKVRSVKKARKRQKSKRSKR